MKEVETLNQTVKDMNDVAKQAFYEISNVVTDEIHKTLNDPSHETNPISLNTKIAVILQGHFSKPKKNKKRIKE